MTLIVDLIFNAVIVLGSNNNYCFALTIYKLIRKYNNNIDNKASAINRFSLLRSN